MGNMYRMIYCFTAIMIGIYLTTYCFVGHLLSKIDEMDKRISSLNEIVAKEKNIPIKKEEIKEEKKEIQVKKFVKKKIADSKYKYDDIIEKYSAKFGADKYLVKSILKAETGVSHYDRNGRVIESNKGAIGIAQIMPRTYYREIKPDLLNKGLYIGDIDMERSNLIAGIYFIGKLTKMYHGDLKQVAAHYNGGFTCRNNKENRMYVKKVMKSYNDFVAQN